MMASISSVTYSFLTAYCCTVIGATVCYGMYIYREVNRQRTEMIERCVEKALLAVTRLVLKKIDA